MLWRISDMEKKTINNGAKLLKALANEKRLQIVSVLENKELKVGELEKKIGLSQSALSQHLAILRASDIVSTRRLAQNVFYAVKNKTALQIVELLKEQ